MAKLPPRGKEEAAEGLLEEFFKHSISRNVAIGLYANGIAVRLRNSLAQRNPIELSERMALRKLSADATGSILLWRISRTSEFMSASRSD